MKGMGGDPPRAMEVQQSADRAKESEIEAHRRAIALHEAAVGIFERLERPDRASRAWRRAEHAREMLALALQEREQAVRARGHPQAHAASGLPPEVTAGEVGGVSGDREPARSDDKPR
jgi:putative ubiquitin-RnfH superfamily antitoxin RatB of RatAB toxin-antitoxin module